MLEQRLPLRPELVTFDAQRQLLDAEIQEAEAMKKPDWGVELAYQRRGREFGDMVSIQFTFDLPIFPERHQDPQIAARQAERAGVDAEREAAWREQRESLDSDLADYERVARALSRARETLLPLAREKADLMLASYRSGRATLTDVIAARRERIDVKLKALALDGERQQSAAKLYFAYEHDLGAEVSK